MAEGQTDRSQYREALVELMAQGVRGAVIVNMVMPRSLPPLARIPASVISAAGFAGVQAFRSLWDGAMGRRLVEPRYRGPGEQVVSDTMTSSAVATSGSIAIGRTVPAALRMGGRVGVAVGAGDAAAETVRQLAEAAHTGALGERTRELFGVMQAAGTAHFGSAAEATSAALRTARARIADLSTAVTTGVGSAIGTAQSIANRLLGAGRAPPPAPTSLPPRTRSGTRTDDAVERAVRLALQERDRERDGDGRVRGYWRTRHIPGTGRTVREYVRPHTRIVA